MNHSLRPLGPEFDNFSLADAVAYFNGTATDFAVFRVGLPVHRQVQEHGNGLAAIRAGKKFLGFLHACLAKKVWGCFSGCGSNKPGANGFHPFAVGPKIRIPQPGRGAKMNRAVCHAKIKFGVVNKAENP